MDYTVGELAKRAGLTVRTLHHYEELGLLNPSGRSDAGYRRYRPTCCACTVCWRCAMPACR